MSFSGFDSGGSGGPSIDPGPEFFVPPYQSDAAPGSGGYQDNANTNADYAPTPEQTKSDYGGAFGDMRQMEAGAQAQHSNIDFTNPPTPVTGGLEDSGGKTYVSPGAYDQGTLPWGTHPGYDWFPYDLPQLQYEATDRRNLQELSDTLKSTPMWSGGDPKAGNFVGSVPLDTSQVIDRRNEGVYTGPLESTYDQNNETWNRQYPWNVNQQDVQHGGWGVGRRIPIPGLK
jgi:hypothetical protein